MPVGLDSGELPTTNDLLRLVNLRDIGGLRTGDGREVRRGALFRSASLWALTPSQMAAIRALQINMIVDLRHNSERAAHPTPWEQLGCERYWCHDHEPKGNNLNDLTRNERLDATAARDLMLKAYRELPYRLVEGIRHLFDTTAHQNSSLLFHCTAGKDRTGVAAALLLYVLGVPLESILSDYLATQKYEILMSPAFRQGNLSIDRLEALRPMYTVDRDYLATMFESIAERDGSVERFLQGNIGISRNALDALRHRLLT